MFPCPLACNWRDTHLAFSQVAHRLRSFATFDIRLFVFPRSHVVRYSANPRLFAFPRLLWKTWKSSKTIFSRSKDNARKRKPGKGRCSEFTTSLLPTVKIATAPTAVRVLRRLDRPTCARRPQMLGLLTPFEVLQEPVY